MGRGGITQYWGDGSGLVVKERQPGAVGCIEYTWTDSFQKASQTDGEGHRHEWRYDDRGNCVWERNPLGLERRRMFDADNGIVELIDEAGRRVALLAASKWAACSGRKPARRRHAIHLRRSWPPFEGHRPYGSSTRRLFEWDTQHNVIRHVDTARGAPPAFSYNMLGRIVAVVDALGRLQVASLAMPFGRVTRLERADSERLSNSYDPEGNLIEQVDSLGRRSAMIYAGQNKLVEHIDPMGHRVRITYDSEEELVAVENQCGEQYRFERDAAGRVKHEIGFDGKKRSYFLR